LSHGTDSRHGSVGGMMKQMRRSRGAEAYLAIPIALAGCTSSTNTSTQSAPVSVPETTATQSPQAVYRTSPLSFSYPGTWNAAHFESISTMSASLVYLSNQSMACASTASPSCAQWPVRTLEPGGVVLWWSANGFPGWTFAQQPGRAVTVAGRGAKISTHRPVLSGKPWRGSPDLGRRIPRAGRQLV
jgi:hypothetical protein